MNELKDYKGFTELSSNEMEILDGGKIRWYETIILTSVVATNPWIATAMLIYKDLKNCYGIGYYS